jgi:hypothetical protein
MMRPCGVAGVAVLRRCTAINIIALSVQPKTYTKVNCFDLLRLGIATDGFRDGCGDAITAREHGDLKPGPAYARLRAVVQTDGCEG